MRWTLAVLALLLAGCAHPAPAPAAAAVVAAPRVADDAVDWHGHVAITECSNGPVVTTCGGSFSIGARGDGSQYMHPRTGSDLTGGSLRLEWTPFTPVTDDLTVTVQVLSGCPDDCHVNRTIASQAGPSPLDVKVPAYPMGGNQSLLVHVQPADFAPGRSASLGQDVHLTGTLRFVVAADAQAA